MDSAVRLLLSCLAVRAGADARASKVFSSSPSSRRRGEVERRRSLGRLTAGVPLARVMIGSRPCLIEEQTTESRAVVGQHLSMACYARGSGRRA